MFVIDVVAADPGRAAALVALGLAALVGAWLVMRGPAPPPVEDTLPIVTAPPVASTPVAEVAPAPVVHVAGAVVTPGVYQLRAGARIADAVEAAGGTLADADLHRLNLAALVHDGQRLYVPRVGEDPPAEVSNGADAGEPTGLIDLNTATQAELETLPGVGPATAEAILAERDRRGRFRSVDELLEVRGIGPAKLAALRDRVRV